MYTYGQVESALAALHPLSANSPGTFRGRIKHLQKLGFVPASPGKGKKIAYEREHLYKWALSLELIELGLDPTLAVHCVEIYWDQMDGILLRERPKSEPPTDWYWLLQPSLMSQAWRLAKGFEHDEMIFDLQRADRIELTALLSKQTRVSIINLSGIRQRLEAALIEALSSS